MASQSQTAITKKWRNIDIPGSFSNSNYFYRGLVSSDKTRGKSENQIKSALKKDIVYQTSRTLRKKFPRRHDLATYFSETWEMDLGDIGAGRFVDLKTGRQKGRFFLLCIDIFSKKIFARGLASKSADDVLHALGEISAQLEPPYTLPVTLECDRGKEFQNKKVVDFCNANKVRLKAARGGNNARTVERAIRSFKKVLIPFLETNPNVSWEDVIEKVSSSLNQRYNRSVKQSPEQVLTGWHALEDRNLKARERKPFLSYLQEQLNIQAGKEVKEGKRLFAIGDKVVIPYKREILDKESDRQFTYVVYTIYSIWTEEKPHLYGLEDGKGVRLKRRFYQQELRKVVEPKRYYVSSILATKTVGRRKFVLVRWLDHDARYDERIPAASIE